MTAVRVPVFFGHSLAVHAKFARACNAADAAALLRRSMGVGVIDADSDLELPTPALLATAPDKVYVGRLRADPTREHGTKFLGHRR